MIKRILTLLTAAVMILTVLTACSDTKTDNTKKDDTAGSSSAAALSDSSKGVDLNALMKTINTNFSLSGLKTIDSADDLQRFYQISPDSVKQFAIEFSSDSSAFTEVAMLEGKDASANAEIKSKLELHLQSQLRNAKSYSPEQVATLEACEVQQNGNFTYLVISDKYEEINSAISEALK